MTKEQALNELDRLDEYWAEPREVKQFIPKRNSIGWPRSKRRESRRIFGVRPIGGRAELHGYWGGRHFGNFRIDSL